MSKKNHSFLKTTFLALASMVAYNTYEYKKATANSDMLKQKYQVYEGKFGKIAYEQKGEGKPIILLHDVDAAANVEEWSNLIRRLSSTYKVFCLDLPGCGRSDKNFVEYSTYMYAMAINDFIRNIVIEDKDEKVLAISSGASSAILALSANIDETLYEHLIFSNPTNIEETYCNPLLRPSIIKAFRYVLNTPVIGSFIFNIIYSKKHITRKVRKSYPHLNNIEVEKLANAMHESSHIGGFNSKFVLSSIRGNLMVVDIARILSKLNVSGTIVAGNGVRAVDKTINSYCKSTNKLEVIRLYNVATPHVEDAAKFADIVHQEY